MNKLLGIRKEVIANLREVQSDIGDTEGLKKEIAWLENERNVAAELVQQLIDQNARVTQNQEDYQRRSDEMFARYEDAEKALAATQGSLHQKEKKMEQIESFITEVEALPDCITEFRTDYWGHLVEKATVHREGKMTFSFACGVEIET